MNKNELNIGTVVKIENNNKTNKKTNSNKVISKQGTVKAKKLEENIGPVRSKKGKGHDSQAKVKALKDYARTVRNYKARVRSYTKKGYTITKLETIRSKKDARALNLRALRQLTGNIDIALRKDNLEEYAETLNWENVYRGDQQVLSNFYKGISSIVNSSSLDDDKEKELIRLSNWISGQILTRQLKILKELNTSVKKNNVNLWGFIYTSGEQDISLPSDWLSGLEEISKKYGYVKKEVKRKGKLNTEWYDKYITNYEMYEKNELFTTNEEGYEIFDKTKAEGIIASWDKTKSFFNDK